MNIKKTLAFSSLTIALIIMTVTGVAAKEIFISSTGSDSANGLTESNAVATFSKAYSLLGNSGGDITVVDSAAYTAAPSHSGTVTVKGKSASASVTLPSEVKLAGNTTFKTLSFKGSSTLYACGKKLVIDSDVTSDSRLNVYGGNKSADFTGNTDITILGGQYNTVFGGGYAGAVNGNTNVVFGGNANPSDSPTDNGSPCNVYGGSNNAAVTGKTNVYLRGNAVAKYVAGTGSGTGGKVKDTNIYIEGGRFMNVYGGSIGAVLDAGTATHVTMTGGSVEAIFGGCNGTSMTGTTTVTLLGGEVTRRVYTGCYNNATRSGFSLKWDSSYHVIGTTLLRIGPNAKLLTGNDSSNRGIFAGSRMQSKNSEESNIIAYLDNCYSSQSSKIGEKNVLISLFLKSYHNYVVKLGEGGTVENANEKDKLVIVPNAEYIGMIGTAYYDNEAAPLSSTTTVTFVKKVVEENGSITFNANGIKKDLATLEKAYDGKILNGWQKNGTYIDLSSGTEITSSIGDVYTPIYTEYTKNSENSDVYTKGAQVRTTTSGSKTVNDLRFVSQFKKSFLANELFGITTFGGANVKYGHVVIPVGERFLKDGELIELDKATSTGMMPKTAAAVNTYSTDGEYVQFTVCITKISKANYERCYAVRPYVIYTDKNGREKIFYGEQYQTASLKSVMESV